MGASILTHTYIRIERVGVNAQSFPSPYKSYAVL